MLVYILIVAGPISNIGAQAPITGCPKVFVSSLDVADTSCDSSIKNVRNAVFKDQLVIKYRNGIKKTIALDSVWGFRANKEYPNRIYENNFYVLYNLSPVYKYSKKIGKTTRYYFSTSLDSPIYPYTPNHLKEHTDPAVYAALVKDAETNRHEIAADFYALNTVVLNKTLWGGGLDMKYFPVRKWATGLSIVFASSHITDTFSFSIRDPMINYWEIGWLNQFNILTKQKFKANVNLVNGLSVFELIDDAQKVPRRTRYGYRNAAKQLATNYYYVLSPGIDLMVRLVSNKNNPDLYITSKVKYRLEFGSSSFASENMFTGLTVALGFTATGFDKMQF